MPELSNKKGIDQSSTSRGRLVRDLREQPQGQTQLLRQINSVWFLSVKIAASGNGGSEVLTCPFDGIRTLREYAEPFVGDGQVAAVR